MSNFMSAMKNEMDNRISITENGAVGYATTGKELLDLNFAVASLRKASEQEIIDKFIDAYYENPMLAMKWLFYASDVREGLGERRLFRVIMNYLVKQHTDIALAVLKLIPEYSRWDNLITLVECDNKKIVNEVLAIIRTQFYADLRNAKENKSISLMAKWLYSENASSKDTKRKAMIIRQYLGLTPKQYRKQLSALRKYLDVVECKMSAKEWKNIDYSAVPSKANIKYSNAFMRNDEERRRAYLESLKKGETKINASVLFPHDVVHKYSNSSYWGSRIVPYDEALEQMWKSLKDIGNIENTIVVADGSGSMTIRVDNNSSVSALEVANALAVYCGERCNGEFKDKYITFSSKPQLVDMTNANSLHDKLEIAYRHNEVSDTNIEAVFNLILKTAVNNHMAQNEIPQNILIISDMEFNRCARSYNGCVTATLFDTIANKYAQYGYKLPKLIFWNVNSRTGTIPVKQNDMGVALVSGFSTNIMKLVLNGELDPYKALVKELNSDRYKAVEEAISAIK